MVKSVKALSLNSFPTIRYLIIASLVINYFKAFDIVLHDSPVEVVDEIFMMLIFLKPLLQSTKHNTTKFLKIMLLPSYTWGKNHNNIIMLFVIIFLFTFTAVPAKALGNTSSLHCTLI